MNFNQIETYVEVVKLGGLTCAARKLFLSQSAVSRQLQALEQDLGCKLIIRDRKKFVLTQEGKRFFRSAEVYYQESKNLFSDIASMRQGVIGNLNFISTPNIAEFVLPHILNKFLLNLPFINVNVTLGSMSQVIEVVSQNQDVLGLGALPEGDDLKAIKIGEDEAVFITYPGHIFTLKNVITISDILGETIILRELPPLETEKKQNPLDLLNYQPKIVMGTTSGVLEAVEAKLGIGLVSILSITKSKAMGLVKVIKVKNFKQKRNLYCIYRPNGLVSPLAQNFVKFIQHYAKENKTNNSFE